MALVSEHSCSIYPANVSVPRRAAIRRRPKLLPPKNKCYTRARINLNQVWPFLDKGQPEIPTSSTPLQSCSNFNSTNHHRQRDQQLTTSRNLQGNDLINYTLHNIEKLTNFNHIPLKHESQCEDRENVSSDIQETNLQNQIHFYTSCSNINFKRAFEEASQKISQSPLQSRQCDSHYRVNESRQRDSHFLINELNCEFPKITLDELPDVLGDCESDQRLTNESESRSVKRMRKNSTRQNDSAFFEHKVVAGQQCFNVHLMASLDQQHLERPYCHLKESKENCKENIVSMTNFSGDLLNSGGASFTSDTALSPMSTSAMEADPLSPHHSNFQHFR